ncbi:class I SAM-dependent methyltransferase [Lacunimicrobium album]
MPGNKLRRKSKPVDMKEVRLPPPRPSEELLMAHAPNLEGAKVLCTTQGRGQMADILANLNPDRHVTLAFFDHYQMTESAPFHQANAGRVELVCQADLPQTGFDLVCQPLNAKGDKEFTRDVMQQAFLSLREGGEMVTAVDQYRDHWLHEEMKKYFDKVTRLVVGKKGVVYQAKKKGTIKKVKDHSAESAFRLGETLVTLTTKPGVFSHRQVDGGARALIKAMDVQVGMNVLDVGCGGGAVGIAAGLSAEGVSVHAVDSNPRAVQCSLLNAQRAGLTEYTCELDSTGASVKAGTFDLVLANPPYFSNYRIAEIFLEVSNRALKKKGKLLLVTKAPNWYTENLPESMEHTEAESIGGYQVLVFKKVK